MNLNVMWRHRHSARQHNLVEDADGHWPELTTPVCPESRKPRKKTNIKIDRKGKERLSCTCKQSSAVALSTPCLQSAPNSVASRTSGFHAFGGCGGRHLKSSTGAAAYGIPLNTCTPVFSCAFEILIEEN